MVQDVFSPLNFTVPKDTPIPLRRKFSSILFEFPWYTEDIVSLPVPLYGEVWHKHEFRNFILALHNFEQTLLSFHIGSDAAPYLLLLGLQREITSAYSSNISLIASHSGFVHTSHDFCKLCDVLTAYRFKEILSISAGLANRIPYSAPSACMYLPPGGPKAENLLSYCELEQWEKVVSTFCNIVKEAASNIPFPFSRNTSPLMSLVRMVEANNIKVEYCSIMENFLYVALEIAAMKYLRFHPGSLPFLPASCPPCPDDVPDRDEYESFAAAYDLVMSPSHCRRPTSSAPRNRRNAMYLSTLISPFYLIMPLSHSMRVFPFRNILEYSSRLGRRSHGIAYQLESEIWNAAFSLSRGKGPAEVILHDLAVRLSSMLENYGQLSDIEKSCFKLPCRIAYKPPPETLALVARPPQTTMNPSNSISDPRGPLVESTVLLATPYFTPPAFPQDQTYPSCVLAISTQKAVHTDLAGLPVPSSPSSVPAKDTEFFGIPLDNGDGSHYKSSSHNDSGDMPMSMVPEVPIPARIDSNEFSEDQRQNTLQPPLVEEDHFIDRDDSGGHNDQECDEEDKQEQEGGNSGNREGNKHKEQVEEVDDGKGEKAGAIGREVEDPDGDKGEDVEDVDGGRVGVGYLVAYADGAQDMQDMGADNEMDDDGDGDDDREESPFSPAPGPSAGFPPRVFAESTGKSKKKKRPIKTPTLVSDDVDINMDGPQQEESQESDPSLKRKRSLSVSVFSNTWGKDRLHGAGSSDNPIDVDALSSIFGPSDKYEYLPSEKISLSNIVTPQITSKEEYIIYNAIGKPIVITPSFHSSLFHVRFRQFMNRIQHTYHNGIPRYVARPDASIISTFTYEYWMNLTSRQRQLQIASRNIVVTGWPRQKTIEFDEDGLKEVAGMCGRQISIQDHSIIPVNDFCSPTTVNGRVCDLWENRGSQGKILNALDFPLAEGDVSRKEYTSDVYAWNLTIGHHNIPSDLTYPAAHMRWSLVGLQNAITFLHLDCEGLSTFIDVLCGGKYWIFLREREGNPLSSPHFFLDKNFHLDRVLDGSNYDFEAIALQPGDRLFMLPNQPHCVYAYEDSMCQGGHFYFTETMQETLYGLVHTFVLHKFLTNTTHPSRGFLRRIVLMYHMGFLEQEFNKKDEVYSQLPDISNMLGVMNMISACILVVLGNVLDFRTYRTPSQVKVKGKGLYQSTLLDCDINAIPANERFAISYARGVALRLMEWIRVCAVITGPDGKTVPDLPSLYLVQVLKTLVSYKKEANTSPESKRDSLFTLNMLESQIHNVVAISPKFHHLFNEGPVFPNSFELQDIEKYRVQWAPNLLNWQGGNKSFLNAGWTSFDDTYFRAQRDRCELEVGILLPEILKQLFNTPAKKQKKELR